MRKLIIGVLAALLLLGGAGAASAGHQEGEGPPNTHGHCTAYFNGQKNGHDDDGSSRQKPFAALEDAGTEYDGTHGGNRDTEDHETERQISDDVFEYCNDPLVNPKGIGGNPEQNGRYDCRSGEEKDSPARDTESTGDQEIECLAQDEATD